MPPHVSRKREHPDSPAPASPPAKKRAVAKPKPKPKSKQEKKTLFDAADELGKKQGSSEKAKKFLDELDNDDESSLSEADSDEFEDVPTTKRRKIAAGVEDEDAEDDDEMDWEDAFQPQGDAASTPAAASVAEPEIGDVDVSVKEDGSYIAEIVPSGVKKGPSKRERQIRIQTHCLHVQALMWHNTVRNSWLNDKEVQKTLVDGLADGVKREITRWRESMGTLTKQELEAKKKAAVARNKRKGGKKGKDTASGRDWSYNASHLEQGVPDTSRGDPLLRLLKILTAYWRKRFTIAAPGLRKEGYKPLRRLRDDIKHWEKNKSDLEGHGERIETVKDFRKAADSCEGSRDVGAQLFVALLRGIGIETRIVANLQPAGFGWSKAEEAEAKSKAKETEQVPDESDEDDVKPKKVAAPKLKSALTPKQSKKPVREEKPTRTSLRGNKGDPISLDDSDSPLSTAPSDNEEEADSADDDDESVVDITPEMPKRKPNKKYDRSLGFPNYWAEVLSPISNKYIPVDPIVLSTIASTDDLLQSFEPRGKKAENAKQVICYTIGYAADGTAKDVTVRYLKKHQLPGKTKGTRMPVEKIPIYNRKGKVRRYEEFDWFRTLMSVYDKPESKRTKADDLEDATDLKPFKPGKDVKEIEKESLQWYKQSAEYVLEQHLRREEALIPGAEQVKMFIAGKGDKAKEYPVYLREDVATCKTVESWHKEGRAIKEGEQPMKHVPMRAVTIIRKREMEDALRETGEKLKQGLYSIDQTDWIIPPPLENGVIPKNAYGNMDVYVPTMVPKGAIHLPLKGSAKLCKRLQIDFAEACTGFEFGKQRAVPVLTGVVVAKENEGIVRDAWRVEQAEQKRKEDTKRTGVALQWWRKMLMGLRIVQRMERDYADAGGVGEEINPFVNKALREGRHEAAYDDEVPVDEEEMAGGFFRPGHEEEEVPQTRMKREELTGGGFFAEGEEEQQDQDEGGGGFLVEEGGEEQSGGFMTEDADDPAPSKPTTAPVSLQMLHKSTDGAMDDDDELDEDDDEDVKPPTRKPAKSTKRPAAARAKRQSISKPKRKLTAPSPSPSASEDEDQQDSMSDLSDVSSDMGAFKAMPERRASSPQVVITPRKTSGRATRGRIPNGKWSTRKATPVKSPYFSSQANDEDEGEDEEDGESDDEVIKPRGTTARTRRAV
jgi:xeroderma pigmentosum group C-complementing protein